MIMEDFKPMKRVEWGFSAVQKPEYIEAQAQKNNDLRQAMDDEGDMLTVAWLDGFHRGREHAATGTEALVCKDVAARQKLGTAKYGTTVCANPLELKQWLQHAYEEALDQAIYLKRAIQELDK